MMSCSSPHLAVTSTGTASSRRATTRAAALRSENGRRAALSLLGGLLVLAPRAGAAILDDVGYVNRATERSPGQCALGDEGRDCRVKLLSDNKALAYDTELKSGTTQGGNRGRPSNNGGGPASTSDAAYATKTAALLAEVERVLALDVLEPSRAAAIQALRTDAGAWCARARRGQGVRHVTRPSLALTRTRPQGCTVRARRLQQESLWPRLLRWVIAAAVALRIQRAGAAAGIHALQGCAQPGGDQSAACGRTLAHRIVYDLRLRCFAEMKINGAFN